MSLFVIQLRAAGDGKGKKKKTKKRLLSWQRFNSKKLKDTKPQKSNFLKNSRNSRNSFLFRKFPFSHRIENPFHRYSVKEDEKKMRKTQNSKKKLEEKESKEKRIVRNRTCNKAVGYGNMSNRSNRSIELAYPRVVR